MSEGKLKPKFTPVPNAVIDEWMRALSDVEFRIVMVIVRQTYGWEEDPKTGRRKEKDWISHSQLSQKTGRSPSSISVALKRVIDELGYVEAYSEEGEILDTAKKRGQRGQKIFYRIDTSEKQRSLFETNLKFRQVKKPRGKSSLSTNTKKNNRQPVQSLDTQSLERTKETVLTKRILAADAAPPQKKPSDHKRFMEFWHEEVQRARGMKPRISPADGKNLKRVLAAGAKEDALEQAAVYFLRHQTFRKFNPSISTLLSAGVLGAIENRMKNDENFWKDIRTWTGVAPGEHYEPVGISEVIRKARAAIGSREMEKVEA